jgi:AAA domain
MKITRGVKPRPRNVLLYGEHKTGKTTLASTFPNPVIIDIEGGSDDLDVDRTPRITTYAEFQDSVSWLLSTDHNFQTVVIDSVDWLEKLVWQFVAKNKGVNALSEIGFGKGFDFSFDEFEKIISALRSLNRRGLATVLIGHAKTVKHRPPEGQEYDRWEPDLHDKVKGPIVEFVDEIFFLKKETFTKSEDLGFNKTRGVAVGTERRILVASDTGSVMAGNRLKMPNEIDADFPTYLSYIIAAQKRATPIVSADLPQSEATTEAPLTSTEQELIDAFEKG